MNEIQVFDNGAELQPVAVSNYSAITWQDIEQLTELAKTVSAKTPGLPSSDSIDYLSLDEHLQVGQTMRITYVARTVERRVEEVVNQHGVLDREYKDLPTVIVMTDSGKLFKNSSFKFVSHFAPQQSGYQAEVKFLGTKKTQKGNRMHNCEFRPLF